MSRDRGGNGIQEVDGSIPFGSTNNSFLHLHFPGFLFSSLTACCFEERDRSNSDVRMSGSQPIFAVAQRALRVEHREKAVQSRAITRIGEVDGARFGGHRCREALAF